MEACRTSQFEQHVRAICDLPLGDPSLLTPVVMVNVLGEHMEPLLERMARQPMKLRTFGRCPKGTFIRETRSKTETEDGSCERACD